MQSKSVGSLPEFTLKAILAGVVLGVVFGAANAYIGLRVGLTVAASIPAAVLTVALFKIFRVKGSILEANMSQTIGSASTSLASGTIFTIPALFLWGMAPPYLQVVALCFLGALLGLSAMIPLRRLLIVESDKELPYPEGTACAEVLRATSGGTSDGVYIFYGMGVGALVKVLVSLAFLVPSDVSVSLNRFLPNGQLAVELAPALIAVGYILGYRQSGVIVSGALISSLVLIPLITFFGSQLAAPLYPETTLLVSKMSVGQIWSKYVRYIGAGSVATAGILTVLKNLPTMISAFTAVAKGVSAGKGDGGPRPETDRDLPPAFVFGGVAIVVLAAAFVPGILAGNMGPLQRAVCAAGVGIFGVLFVAVAARIVGIVGVSSQPTSGITLVTLLGVASVFAAAGWVDAGARAAVLTVGTIVAVAASKAGDISQDLKTGYLVGATPARQQLGQLIGASVACWAVAATVLLLGQAFEFGSKEIPAPQATLMKTIIEGVLSGALPWGLVLSGAGLSVAAMLMGVSGLAFAIGVYLPLSSMAAIFVGGCVRGLVENGRETKKGEGESDPGVLAASGLVAGEGLAGITVALLVVTKVAPKSMDPRLGGLAGELGTVALLLAVCAFLYLSARRKKPA